MDMIGVIGIGRGPNTVDSGVIKKHVHVTAIIKNSHAPGASEQIDEPLGVLTVVVALVYCDAAGVAVARDRPKIKTIF